MCPPRAAARAARAAPPPAATELRSWLQAASGEACAEELGRARGVIAPHAGYRYSGSTAAHAYAALQAAAPRVSRVFVLGPSHHWFTRRCALSAQEAYETPLGELAIDQDVCAQLAATGKFETMSKQVDEDEHSIELHMPYIAECVGMDVAVVPILVGALTAASEAEYGALLAPYLRDEANFFVVSSDFCHWGRRFNYTYHDASEGPIHKSIEALDRRGMAEIESGAPEAFTRYLARYENTICGRHPIGVMMCMAKEAGKHHGVGLTTKFVKYAQSSQCKSGEDSSVSYASALVLS